MAAITKGIVTSFGNTPQAVDDVFNASALGIGSSGSYAPILIDVMANDKAGGAKTLYSLDNADSLGGIRPTDLLAQDLARTEAASTDTSLNGARIWITADGQVGYDASTLSSAALAQIQGLGAGQYFTDTFTYAIRMANGTLSWATAQIKIAGTNDAPVAVDDVASTAEDTPLLNLNVLGNDTDVDGNPLSISGTPTALHGTITVNSNGTLNYTPNANYYGSDTITYTVTDGTVTDTGQVTITVNPVNDAPVAEDDVDSGDEDTVISGSVAGNDSDVDGDSLTYSLVSGVDPLDGELSFDAAGNYSFTPAANFHGEVTFTYQANDGSGALNADSNVATVTITVNPVNDAPVAEDDVDSGDEDTVISGSVAGNDSDVDGDSLTYSLVSGVDPLDGELSFDAAGNYSFTPAANFHGEVTFTYQANDGSGALNADSNVATVTITVNPVNDAPVLSDTTDPVAVVELTDASSQNLSPINGTFSVAHSEVGLTLTPSVVGSPVVNLSGSPFTLPAGAAALTALAAFTLTGTTSNGGSATIGYSYDPTAANLDFLAAGQSLTITYTVQVSDGNSASGTQDVTFTITGTNDVPVITSNGGGASASISLTENSSAVTTVTATDLDAGASITYSIVGGADAAKFAINASTGALTFVTAPDFEAPTDAGANNIYDVIVRASDGIASDDQAIAVTVTNLSDVETNGTNNSSQQADVVTLVNGVGQVSGSVVGSDSDFFRFVTVGSTAYQIVSGDRIVLDLNGPAGSDVSLWYVDDPSRPQDAVEVTAGIVYDPVTDVLTYDVDSSSTHSGGTYFARVAFAGSGGSYTLNIAVTPGIIGANGVDDVLTGSSGGENILGLSGNDTLYGLDGNDSLEGGVARDLLYGGTGDDRFVYTAIADSQPGATNRDTIFDFASGDKIDLSAIDANTNTAGNGTFLFVAAATATITANSVSWHQAGGNTYIHGDNNGDGVADFEIELLGTRTMVSGDFGL